MNLAERHSEASFGNIHVSIPRDRDQHREAWVGDSCPLPKPGLAPAGDAQHTAWKGRSPRTSSRSILPAMFSCLPIFHPKSDHSKAERRPPVPNSRNQERPAPDVRAGNHKRSWRIIMPREEIKAWVHHDLGGQPASRPEQGPQKGWSLVMWAVHALVSLGLYLLSLQSWGKEVATTNGA